jgi:hypothetical protein
MEPIREDIIVTALNPWRPEEGNICLTLREAFQHYLNSFHDALLRMDEMKAWAEKVLVSMTEEQRVEAQASMPEWLNGENPIAIGGNMLVDPILVDWIQRLEALTAEHDHGDAGTFADQVRTMLNELPEDSRGRLVIERDFAQNALRYLSALGEFTCEGIIKETPEGTGLIMDGVVFTAGTLETPDFQRIEAANLVRALQEAMIKANGTEA